MASRSRNSIAITVLCVVLLAVAGYFAWSFLAPPPSLAPVARSTSSDLPADVLRAAPYAELHTFAAPAAPRTPGRANPFEPLPKSNTNVNAR